MSDSWVDPNYGYTNTEEDEYEWTDGSYHDTMDPNGIYTGFGDPGWDDNYSGEPGSHLIYYDDISNVNTPSDSTDDYSSDNSSSYSYSYQVASYSYQVANSYSYTTADSTIRQRNVKFSVTGLTPLLSGCYLTFNQTKVPSENITPDAGYSFDSTGNGTMQTDSNGNFSGTFKIPKGIPVGAREVVFTNGKDSASAVYTASGTTTHTGTYYTTETYDPVAEIFKLDNDYFVTSIDIPFGSKDDTEPVKLQIRETTDANSPSNVVVASKMVNPTDISASEDGSVFTNIKLDQPIMLNKDTNYALTLGSNSNNYTTFIGKIGNNDLITNNKVNSQPYTAGILYTSSNGNEWTPDQYSDLKFKINVAKFDTSSTIVFNPMSNISLDTFDIFAKYITPNQTNIKWSYRMLTKDDENGVEITDKPWSSVLGFNLTNVHTIAKSVQLKADFTSSEYSSPKLGISSLSFLALTTSLTGNWISKNIDLSNSPFNTVSIDYMGYTPFSSTITPFYSLDGGNTWKQVVVTPTITDSTNNWKEYNYKFSVSKATISQNMPNQIKFKVVLSTQYSYLKPYMARFMTVMDQE